MGCLAPNRSSSGRLAHLRQGLASLTVSQFGPASTTSESDSSRDLLRCYLASCHFPAARPRDAVKPPDRTHEDSVPVHQAIGACLGREIVATVRLAMSGGSVQAKCGSRFSAPTVPVMDSLSWPADRNLRAKASRVARFDGWLSRVPQRSSRSWAALDEPLAGECGDRELARLASGRRLSSPGAMARWHVGTAALAESGGRVQPPLTS